tara:strand:+ start:172 stop:486 length:315 start_codon:yes stop_codon:yes gene_type:complete
MSKAIFKSDIEELPSSRPASSGNDAYLWWKHQVDQDQRGFCELLGIQPGTMRAKMIGVRKLTTGEVYKAVRWWVHSGRRITNEEIGAFVVCHGKLYSSKEPDSE